MTTERPETVEGGAHIVAGLDAANIAAAVETIVTLPWSGRYELEQDFAPSTVVVNTIRSKITNFF
jgi:UDP-N-acetylglucosamine 2-epimerase (non-hydrolysing)